MFESWIIDFRYAARRLATRRTYAALAVLTIALGAGGAAAIFGVVRALLLDPLPISREEQVGVLWFQLSWTEEEFLRMRPDFPGFQRMAAYRPVGGILAGPDGALQYVSRYAVSAEFFDVLGVRPMLGRTFEQGEDIAEAERVVVLAHALWRELGADPGIVGKPLVLDGAAHRVVGVMPRGFWFPSPGTRVWTAAPMSPQNRAGQYSLTGRLAEGRSFDSMAEPLQALTQRLAENFEYSDPQWDRTRNPSVTPVREFLVGDVRTSLLATMAAMGVILLMGCANVTALILGQIDARESEIAVRGALGANGQRLVQQLVIEALLLGALAGACGAAFAAIGFEAIAASLPLGELAANVRLDWTVFWISMLASLGAAVLSSILPAVHVWRGRLRNALSSARAGGAGIRGGRLEGVLVVAQMALAVVLVVGAGLLIRSVANLRSIDAGLRVDEIAVVEAILPGRRPAAARRQAVEAVLPSLRALPGVNSVAAAQLLPLRNRGDNWGFDIQGRPDPNTSTAFRMVTSDYFTTMGIPILRGRNFGSEDTEATERVVIVNEAFGARFFPGEDPIGHVLQTFDEAGERIVGVAGNTLENGLTNDAVPARYMLYGQIPSPPSRVSFVLRTADDESIGTLLTAARSAIVREGGFVVDETTTMRSIFDAAMGPTAQVVNLLSLLGALGLALGAIGVYGVASHYVQRRSRDYGVRIALGEQPSQVFRQVVGRGALLAATGAVIGVAASLPLTRLLSSLLYSVEPADPPATLAAVTILMLVGIAATYIPARRASRTDPAAALRQT